MDRQDFANATARMLEAGKITAEERAELLRRYDAGEIDDLPLALDEFAQDIPRIIAIAALCEWILANESPSNPQELARWAVVLRREAIQRQRAAEAANTKLSGAVSDVWERQAGRVSVQWSLSGGPAQTAEEAAQAATRRTGQILGGLPFSRKRNLAREYVGIFHDEAGRRTANLLFGDYDDGMRRWQAVMREMSRDDLLQMAALGKGEPLNADDLNRLGRAWRKQQAHLARFSEEIMARREAGRPMTQKAIQARARQYAGAQYSAYWRYQSEAFGAGVVLDWNAVDDAGTCGACLRAQAAGPYPAGEPHPVPGATVCLGNGLCRCWLSARQDQAAYDDALARWNEQGDAARVVENDPLL